MKAELKKLAGQMAFVHPGKTLAIALLDRAVGAGRQNDGMVSLWDVSGKEPIEKHAFQAQTMKVTDLASSSDGKVLACYSKDANTVQLWDMSESPPRQGALVSVPPKVTLLSMVLSADGKTLSTYVLDTNGSHNFAWFWDVSGPEAKEQSELKERITTKNWAFAPNGKWLATASVNVSRLNLWTPATGDKLAEINLPPMDSFAFAPDSRHVAVSNLNGTVYIVRLENAPHIVGK